jgi:hypothetical protein
MISLFILQIKGSETLLNYHLMTLPLKEVKGNGNGDKHITMYCKSCCVH